MKRILLCLSALAGLCLGFCTQPREIRNAPARAAAERSATMKAAVVRAAQPALRTTAEWLFDTAVSPTTGRAAARRDY